MAICAASAPCPREAVKRSYCEAHYRQWWRTGETRALRYDRTGPKVCVICGASGWADSGRRKHCSSRCQQLDFRHSGARPRSVQCRQCGCSIDLDETTRSGKVRRSDVKICATCRRAKSLRHKVSVGELFARGDVDCGICGGAVDRTLAYPDPMSPSIDHVVPFAHGGTHDLTNLQLSHLRCNHVKSDRIIIPALNG